MRSGDITRVAGVSRVDLVLHHNTGPSMLTPPEVSLEQPPADLASLRQSI